MAGRGGAGASSWLRYSALRSAALCCISIRTLPLRRQARGSQGSQGHNYYSSDSAPAQHQPACARCRQPCRGVAERSVAAISDTGCEPGASGAARPWRQPTLALTMVLPSSQGPRVAGRGASAPPLFPPLRPPLPKWPHRERDVLLPTWQTYVTSPNSNSSNSASYTEATSSVLTLCLRLEAGEIKSEHDYL